MKPAVFLSAAALILLAKITLAGDITLVSGMKAHGNHLQQTAAEKDDQTLRNRLPDDADHENLHKQKRAMSRGFYWTKENKLKPLRNVF